MDLPPGFSRPTRQKTPASSSNTPSTSSSTLPTSLDMAPTRQPSAPAAKASRASRSLAHDKNLHPSSKDSLRSTSSKKLEEAPKVDKNEEMLRFFRSDFDSLRSLITCKICDRLLYEPYVISCGHTYCYSCLCTWFVNNRNRKTCPDCRSVVIHPPAPAYLIREMTTVFINRTELLPTGETEDQHKQWQKEEADIVQADKSNSDGQTGGLFKGCFKVRPEAGLRVVRDQNDGIDRCPMCAWELVDRECSQCGLQFDETGALTWDNSFTGFSDMDETSEHDTFSEDLEADIDGESEDSAMGMDEDDDMDDMPNEYYDNENNFADNYAVRRWLAHEMARPQVFGFGAPRRRAAHSAAGSNRRSYSASIASDMVSEDTEMGTLEEEDEDEDDGSSMHSFIDDGEPEMPSSSRASGSMASQTPTPPRRRRVATSESSSNVSHSVEEVDDDEDDDVDDEGPISHGGRRTMFHALQQRRPRARVAPSTSSVGDDSIDGEFDEEATQHLLREAGWSPLEPEDQDDEMEDDDDDDSDGGRTTVGWAPIANSVERSRAGGSLTPTADRPNVAIRPPSRAGNTRFLDGSRGLRRRSSVLSGSSGANYEDGEADDDDSDIDRDGDNSTRSPVVRPRSSRVRLRGGGAGSSSRPPSSAFSGNAVDQESEGDSDETAGPGARSRRFRGHRQEYDPRISLFFAQHMAELRDIDMERQDAVLGHLNELRATTPVARPRTVNRNRNSAYASQHQALPNSALPPLSPPANVPARLRTPSNHNSSGGSSAAMLPRSGRSHGLSSQATLAAAESSIYSQRRNPTPSSVASGTTAADAPAQPQSFMEGPHAWSNNIATDASDRPLSRTSTSSSRYSSGSYQGPISPGLNFAARLAQTRNPFNPYMALGPRPRQSNQRLREQSSTATLRPRQSQRGLRQQPSHGNVRDANVPAQHVRQQSSRVNLRSQPSQHRLSSQASSRALRNANSGGMHQSNGSTTSIGSNGSTSGRSRLTEEERLSRARELVISRQQALSTGTNPFTAGRGRGRPPSQDSTSSTGASSRSSSQYSVGNAPSSTGVMPGPEYGSGSGPAPTQTLAQQQQGLASTAGYRPAPARRVMHRYAEQSLTGQQGGVGTISSGSGVNSAAPGLARTRAQPASGVGAQTYGLDNGQGNAGGSARAGSVASSPASSAVTAGGGVGRY
ncbi:uncharacterized protein IWZ02DRAFT_494694 [Phyllosticta citriasiana]|uniref:RING-type domain-containing protein n=1 Tax=Phyllosticta citriasiana TaxID=595635 RepID=A0ABR1KEQ0_9PEZI